jgi:hypothetical protein
VKLKTASTEQATENTTGDAELQRYTAVASVLLNLDAALTR